MGYEHDITSSIDGYSKNVAYIGTFNLNLPSLHKNRTVTLVYNLGHDQSVNFDLMHSQQALNNGDGITAYLD